ncbi:hypothetical protein F4825DRAFT_430809 [Nemania diffusa]|nr:hypothetical protein F4825DRAFT_430809 [Nemania diffusa]
MSVALPVQVPDFRALGVHAHALADGLTGCANLPAFNDPNITTKLEKLDTVTRDIDNLKRDLITSITEALTEALTEVIDKKFDAFTKKIDDVKQEVGAVKQEVGAVKQEVSAVKQGLGAVEKRLDAVEKRLGAVEQKVGSVERNLSTSIAAREMNGLVRTKNRRSSKLEPLHSVFTNEPIANFPQSIAQFKRLNSKIKFSTVKLSAYLKFYVNFTFI